jgi:hypothetical protein
MSMRTTTGCRERTSGTTTALSAAFPTTSIASPAAADEVLVVDQQHREGDAPLGKRHGDRPPLVHDAGRRAAAEQCHLPLQPRLPLPVPRGAGTPTGTGISIARTRRPGPR